MAERFNPFEREEPQLQVKRAKPFVEEPESQPVKKVKPFKEEEQKEQPARQQEPAKHHSRLDKQVTISLSPRRLVKGFLLIALLMAVFYLGRLSGADVSYEFKLPDLSGLTDIFHSDETSPSGLATADTEEADKVAEEMQAAPEEATAPAEEPADAQQNGTVAPAEEKEEIVVVTYSRVALSLDEVYKDWKGTWGKITGIKYTIKNNEVGTVKPHHFIMLVEGYDTDENKIEKEFEVGIATQRVKAGETKQDEASVGGFSYNPASIPDGDLKKVRITLILYDAEGKSMASHNRDVDLSGN